jgi:hypothetical protein
VLGAWRDFAVCNGFLSSVDGDIRSILSRIFLVRRGQESAWLIACVSYHEAQWCDASLIWNYRQYRRPMLDFLLALTMFDGVTWHGYGLVIYRRTDRSIACRVFLAMRNKGVHHCTIVSMRQLHHQAWWPNVYRMCSGEWHFCYCLCLSLWSNPDGFAFLFGDVWGWHFPTRVLPN